MEMASPQGEETVKRRRPNQVRAALLLLTQRCPLWGRGEASTQRQLSANVAHADPIAQQPWTTGAQTDDETIVRPLSKSRFQVVDGDACKRKR